MKRRAITNKRTLCMVVFVVGPFVHTPIVAQSRDWRPPEWFGELAFGATNALLAGLTAGVLQELHGGSFSNGFAAGALGGTIVYGGKRLATAGFFGAGLMGREFAALGSSMTRNASREQPLLSELVMPVGPLHFYVQPARLGNTRLRISATEVESIVWGLSRSELELDIDRSISAGAFTFFSPGHYFRASDDFVLGFVNAGVIFLSTNAGPVTFAHERIHVLQRDFVNTVWGIPVETAIGKSVGPIKFVQSVFDLDVTSKGLGGITRLVFGARKSQYLFELEAEFLGAR